MWQEIFAGSNFCDFSSDPKNKFPQKKLPETFFAKKFTPE